MSLKATVNTNLEVERTHIFREAGSLWATLGCSMENDHLNKYIGNYFSEVIYKHSLRIYTFK